MTRTPSRHRRAAGALLCALLASLSATAQAAPADDLKALMDRGQARQAYALGKQNPGELGKAEFDYFFGMAAIDAGEPADGVLALERYLLNNPGSVVARLELGRGYFMLGDTPRAREMFEEVLKLNPPAEVRARIDRFMAAIKERESAYQTTMTGFLEANAGRDSNVNSGIGQDSITLPLFGTLTLSADGRETSDTFTGYNGGFQVNHPIRPGVALFAGAGIDSRKHRKAGQFDQRTLSAAAGISINRDADSFRFSVTGNGLDVDSKRYRGIKAATAEWSRSLDANRGFTFYAQYAHLAYSGANEVRDAKLKSVGATWRQSFDGRWQPFLTVGINAGQEDNRRNRNDLGRDTFGARAGLGLTLAPRINAALSLNWQESKYQAFDDFLGATRKDQFAALELALGYSFTPNLNGRIEISRYDNDSNLSLFEYKRNVAAVKLRYDFK